MRKNLILVLDAEENPLTQSGEINLRGNLGTFEIKRFQTEDDFCGYWYNTKDYGRVAMIIASGEFLELLKAIRSFNNDLRLVLASACDKRMAFEAKMEGELRRARIHVWVKPIHKEDLWAKITLYLEKDGPDNLWTSLSAI